MNAYFVDLTTNHGTALQVNVAQISYINYGDPTNPNIGATLYVDGERLQIHGTQQTAVLRNAVDQLNALIMNPRPLIMKEPTP